MNLPKSFIFTINTNDLKKSTIIGMRLCRLFFWLAILSLVGGLVIVGLVLAKENHDTAAVYALRIAVALGGLFVLSCVGYGISTYIRKWEIPMSAKKAKRYEHRLRRYEYYYLLWAQEKKKAIKNKELKHQKLEEYKKEKQN